MMECFVVMKRFGWGGRGGGLVEGEWREEGRGRLIFWRGGGEEGGGNLGDGRGERLWGWESGGERGKGRIKKDL